MTSSSLRLLPLLLILLMLGAAPAAARAEPLPVSPGDERGTARIESPCPGFSWSGVDGADAYELVVVRLDPAGEPLERADLRVKVPGGANSWTPDTERCLRRGERYAWAVRAVGAERKDPWSTALWFEVAGKPSDAELRRALALVRDHLSAGGDLGGLSASVEAPRPGLASADAPVGAPDDARERVPEPADEPTAEERDLVPRGAEPTGVVALRGSASDPAGENVGVLGTVASGDPGAAGVSGRSTSVAGVAPGLEGTASSPAAPALQLDHLAGGDLFRGLSGGVEVLSIDAAGTIDAPAFVGDGSGLTGVDAATLDGSAPGDFATGDHDHFDESWSGSGAGSSGLLVETTGTTSNALHGRVSGLSSAGVQGESTLANFAGYGVRGLASGNGGHGVRGEATSSSGSPRALSADVQSGDGFGLHVTGAPGSQSYFERSVGIGTEDPSNKFHVRYGVTGSSITSHIALIENTSTSTGADGLAIKAGPNENPGGANNFISFFDGDGNYTGEIQGNGDGGMEMANFRRTFSNLDAKHAFIVQNNSSSVGSDGLGIRLANGNPTIADAFLSFYRSTTDEIGSLTGDGNGGLSFLGLTNVVGDLRIAGSMATPGARLEVADSSADVAATKIENTVGHGLVLSLPNGGFPSSGFLFFEGPDGVEGMIYPLNSGGLWFNGLTSIPGNLGIGTTLPQNRLHVSTNASGNDEASHVVQIHNAASTGDGLFIELDANNPENRYLTFGTSADVYGTVQGNGAGGIQITGDGADYAEWLPRLDPSEELRPGDIVGLHGGAVSLETAGADRVMALSTGSIVLGNTPPEGEEEGFAPIAFVGQVTVRVRGPVVAGDPVLPSGANDGTAVAAPRERLTAEDLSAVLGRSLETATGPGLHEVRVLVGLPDAGTLTPLLAALRSTVDEQRSDLASLRAMVDEQGVALAALRRQLDAVTAPRLAALPDDAPHSRPSTSTGTED